MDTLKWEGIEWTITSRWQSKHRTMKCDGCEGESGSIGRYSATDPLGAVHEAKWCPGCEQDILLDMRNCGKSV